MSATSAWRHFPDRHPTGSSLLLPHTTHKLVATSSTPQSHIYVPPPRRRSQILTKTLCGDTQLSSQRIGVLTIESRVDVLRCHRAYIVRDIRRHLCDFGVNRHRDTRIGDEPSDHEAFAGMRILP